MNKINTVKNYFSAFIRLFFPDICIACDEPLSGNEPYLCTSCLANLPQTNYWNQPGNPVEQLFWGRAPVDNAAAFIFFEKGSIFQNIFHQLKYNGKKEIGQVIGRYFGQKLKESRFNSVDIIVPIPLHKSRERKRGFNQSEIIAKGIALAMDKPLVTNAIVRFKSSKTQTTRHRYDRWLNVEGIFTCTTPALLENKHILLVDDIITTGATMESLIQEIIKISGVKISIATLAVA